MKTIKRLFAVALTAALFAPADFASAQRIGAGIGNGIGSRLTGRNQARQTPAEEELILQQNEASAQAQPQAQAPAAQTPAAQPGVAASGQAAARPAVKKSNGSEFVLPANATNQELVAKADELMTTEVAFETEAEYEAWVKKMLTTISQIGDRILKSNPTDDEFVQAITLKGQALCYQASLDSAALPRLGAYATTLEQNAKVQSLEGGQQAALAFKGVYLQAKVADIAENNGTSQELVAVMKDVLAFITAHPETSDMTVDLVFPVALVAETQNEPKLPAQIWTPIRKQLASSDTAEAKNALQLLEGTIRYSELEGKPFVWKGCKADGTKFDPKEVQGKVILVDFWASWCEPCPELHAQLKELYKKYHEQGFEIVGYNLDADQKEFDAYLKKDPLPWILMSDRATVDAKETSLAAYYGISEIPTMVLIGGDGKVAALDIGMESLVATLESVFAQTAAKTPAAGAATATGARAAGTGTASSGAAAATGARANGTTVNPASRSATPSTIRSNGAAARRN